MDPTTRHQLKQNELAEALARLRHLDTPAARYGLAGLAIVLVLVLAWKGWQYARHRSLEQGWQQLSRITGELSQPDAADPQQALDDLRALIRDTSDPALSGYARIRLARTRCDEGIKDAAQRPAAFEEAVEVLRQVTQNPDTPPIVAAAAWFALGDAYESLREFDKAAAAYETVTSNQKQYAGSPYIALAASRQKDLDQLRKPVVFEPGAPPAPATQPAEASTGTEGVPPDESVVPPVEPAAPSPGAESEPAAPAEQPESAPAQPESPPG